MHILIPDTLHADGIAIIQQHPELTFHHPGKQMTRDEVLAVIGEADALILRSGTKADANLLNQANNLKVIARAGVGVDNVDLSTATERGIIVMNTPAGNTIATAEMAMGLMLSLARYIPQSHHDLQVGRWERKKWMGTELYRKTLGMIGFGRIGQAVAHRALAFGMSVLAYDPYLSDQVEIEPGVTRVHELDELYAEADFISLHSLVTDETYHMINAESLAKMKKGVRIINDARGGLIDTQALAEAIKSGKVAGAALDVYEVEPPPTDNPLFGLEAVIHTPHLGASTHEAQEAVALEAAELVVDALLNKNYQNVVNREVLF